MRENEKENKTNSFTMMMKMFDEADTLYLEPALGDIEMVVGSPMDSKPEKVWMGMAMVSSFEQAVEAGYPIATDGSSKKLDDKLTDYF